MLTDCELWLGSTQEAKHASPFLTTLIEPNTSWHLKLSLSSLLCVLLIDAYCVSLRCDPTHNRGQDPCPFHLVSARQRGIWMETPPKGIISKKSGDECRGVNAVTLICAKTVQHTSHTTKRVDYLRHCNVPMTRWGSIVTLAGQWCRRQTW